MTGILSPFLTWEFYVADTEQPDSTAMTVQLLSAYFSNNQVPASDIAGIIEATRGALERKAAVETSATPEHVPAVSVRKSLGSREHIISMLDGKPYKTLKRHLATNGLTPAEYRERYNLPKDYPMIAPAYSEQRRAVAQQLGLGRRAGAKSTAETPAIEAAAVVEAAPVPEAIPAPTPVTGKKPRRGRVKAAPVAPGDQAEAVALAPNPEPVAAPAEPETSVAAVKPGRKKSAVKKPSPDAKAPASAEEEPIAAMTAEPAKPVARKKAAKKVAVPKTASPAKPKATRRRAGAAKQDENASVVPAPAE
jgi:predicted transcriptional regulator